MNFCSKKEQIWCCSAQKLSELFTEAGVTLKSWVMGNSLFVDSGRVIYTKQNSTSLRKGSWVPKEGVNKTSYPMFWKYSEVCGIISEEETQDPTTQITTTDFMHKLVQGLAQ